MSRQAILFANKAKSREPRTSVTKKVAQKNTSEIKKHLEGLGDTYRFKTEIILDETKSDAHNLLSYYAKKAKGMMHEDSDFLLFYYFGHGVIRKNMLYFYLRESNDQELATMISFDEVANILFGHNIPKVLFIIDCCHSGAATSLPSYSDKNYSIIASCTHLQKAFVNEKDSPFGAFSTIFFTGLHDIAATQALTRQITTKSLFDHTCKLLMEYGFNQQPQLHGNGLISEVLSEALFTRFIDPKFNESAHVKSFYKKLKWIGSEIKTVKNITEDGLYDIVKMDKPTEMLTPHQKPGGIVKNEPVKKTTFNIYIKRMEKLDILTNNGSLKLTKKGRQLLANNERSFNKVMIEIINKQLEKSDSSLKRIDRLIDYILKTRGVPTAKKIHRDAQKRERLKMEPEWFGILLDLAAYAGFFRSVPRKTYFSFD